MSTDEKIGEGFAFFRWHCLRWARTTCKGFNDRTAYCGDDWMSGDRG